MPEVFPDDKTLAVGGRGGIRLLQLESNEIKTKYEEGIVTCLDLHPRLPVLAFAKVDEVYVISTRSDQVEFFGTHDILINELAFTSDGSSLISVGHDKAVKLWKLQKREVTTLKGHSSIVSCAAVSPNAETLVTGGAELLVWSLSALKPDEYISSPCHLVLVTRVQYLQSSYFPTGLP